MRRAAAPRKPGEIPVDAPGGGKYPAPLPGHAPGKGDALQGAAADCKSAGETHAWFDSRVAHHPFSDSEPAAMIFRPATADDAETLWAMLEPVFRAGDTYAVDPGIGRESALGYWCGGNHSTWLAEDEGEAIGTYYICPNQGGGGAHVCNCGFVTARGAEGRGVARAMLKDALARARMMGYRAMQFNFVVETNARAVALWQSHGFATVGRLPGAFRHPERGYVDALVMYRDLTGET